MALIAESPAQHPFIKKPHKTLLALSFPALFSLIAEPFTGLVDTAFVASLGSAPLAALGIGTAVLTSVFWIFSFLGVSSQTEVAQALGKGEGERATSIYSLALLLGLVGAALLIFVILPFAAPLVRLMGADAAVTTDAVVYLRWRLIGAPALLMTMIGFGALRGLQDMQTPLWIAVVVNIVNIALDGPFIFGWSIFPALGVAGAGLASSISQWLGALLVVTIVHRRLGFTREIRFADARRLLVVGSDLFMRTGLLTTFLLLATRVANQAGADSGAAHQAIRQVFVFTALLMEAFALTAQSLVGYFIGANMAAIAKRVVTLSLRWCFATGVLVGLGMWMSTSLVGAWLVPAGAVTLFAAGWIISAIAQPINTFAFITDGVHWGTGDYRYMRNGMFIATAIAIGLLQLIDVGGDNVLAYVWGITLIWVMIRGVIGMLRIFPGIGNSPFRNLMMNEEKINAL